VVGARGPFHDDKTGSPELPHEVRRRNARHHAAGGAESLSPIELQCMRECLLKFRIARGDKTVATLLWLAHGCTIRANQNKARTPPLVCRRCRAK
jgi:hypothetical protein